MLPARVDRARDLCAEWVKSGHTPALSVCVARRGVIVLNEGFGQSGVGDDAKPVAADSIWPVASTSKPVTSALVMQLVDEGLIGLNRPAIEYLPELSGEGVEEILLHHLLTHTSGYPWHTDPSVLHHAKQKLESGFEPPPCPPGRHPSLHPLLEILWDLPRDHPAGESMTYSNHNILLLGELVRRVRDMPFEDAAQQYLFGPLGMKDSYFSLPESEWSRYVVRPPKSPLAEAIPGYFEGFNSTAFRESPHPGGGLCTTPFDLVVFGQLFLNAGCYGDARVLSPAAIGAMSRDQIPGLEANIAGHKFSPASWSYGFSVESSVRLRFFRGNLSSGGSLHAPGAAGCGFWIDPPRELVGCYSEACLGMTDDFEFLTNYDLFENVINSAVDD